MPILECNNLTKTYAGVTALDHIDLAIDPGRIVGLLGPNAGANSDRREKAVARNKRRFILSSRAHRAEPVDEGHAGARLLLRFL